MRSSQINTISSCRKSGKGGSLRWQLGLDAARSTLRGLRMSVRRLYSSGRLCVRYIRWKLSMHLSILAVPKDLRASEAQ